jgi:hypothetical protein
MKLIITESQLKYIIKENVDEILDRINDVGFENLTPSEKRKLNYYQQHLEKGGSERNFNYSDEPDIDERSGKRFETIIEGNPLVFTFSEKTQNEYDEIEYYGDITYRGNEYIGGIFTDHNGFLIDFDFYDSLDNESKRLQDIIKKGRSKLDSFFQNEVISSLG